MMGSEATIFFKHLTSGSLCLSHTLSLPGFTRPRFHLWDFKHADTHTLDHIDTQICKGVIPWTLVRVAVAQISKVLITTRQQKGPWLCESCRTK